VRFKTENALTFAMENHGGFSSGLISFAVGEFRAGKLTWNDVDPRVTNWVKNTYAEPVASQMDALLVLGILRGKWINDQGRAELTGKVEDISLAQKLLRS
jgi:hypothetical protein